MKSPFRTSILAIAALALPSVALTDTQYAYVSAGGYVTAWTVQEDGQLEELQQLEIPSAGPIGVSNDSQTLYVRSTVPVEGKKGVAGIATVALAEGGTMELIQNAPAVMAAGYLWMDATANYLTGNNYGQGTVAVWPLENGVYTGTEPQIVELEQKAHSAVFSPDNRFLLVPATGPNKVFQLTFDEKTGTIAHNDPPSAEGPAGEDEARQPRHLVFHPTMDMVYTTNERERPGVGVWKWDAETGTLETVQNIVSFPEGFEGTITTADLHLTPDARFLYISNRDITDRQATSGESSIVGFKVDAETGLLEMIGHFPCAHVPRSFDVDETGQFVYVAGQGDSMLDAFRINQDNGELEKIATYETGDRPSWVTCVIPGE